MYFKNFPTIIYDGTVVTDITLRVHLREKIKEAIGAWDYYIVKEGESIEEIADKAYGNPNYHWVIMLLNDIVDPIYDWILTQEELNDYITKAYGADADATRYTLLNGRIVDAGTPSSTPVTNREYEETENEKKREIMILKPEFLESILTEFNTITDNA